VILDLLPYIYVPYDLSKVDFNNLNSGYSELFIMDLTINTFI
jgi:hypothetical protein